MSLTFCFERKNTEKRGRGGKEREVSLPFEPSDKSSQISNEVFERNIGFTQTLNCRITTISQAESVSETIFTFCIQVSSFIKYKP